MTDPRLALWLLARIDSSERHESLVGDLLEEVATGRSRLWIWQQVIGAWGFALVTRARSQTRFTSHLLVLAPSAIVLTGVLVAPYWTVLQTWAGIYVFTGTLSLFGHMLASSSFHSRALVVPADPD